MNMVFCRGCGVKIHATAIACPECGAPQKVLPRNTTPIPTPPAIQPKVEEPVPEGVKGWSWGAFLLNWIWAIGNRVWWGLLALVPLVGLVVAVLLGIKGREYAWRARSWDSVEHFQAVQRKWSKAGVALLLVGCTIGLLAGVGIPAYHDYQVRSSARANAQDADTRMPQTLPEERADASTAGQNGDSAKNSDAKQFIDNAVQQASMEYDRKWKTILDNPQKYFDNCVTSEKGPAMRQGGMNEIEAENHATAICNTQLTGLKVCMDKPGAKAMNCFTDVVERGD